MWLEKKENMVTIIQKLHKQQRGNSEELDEQMDMYKSLFNIIEPEKTLK